MRSTTGNCVRVSYETGFHVEVPVYRRVTTRDVLGKETYHHELASSEWKRSDARDVTAWFETEDDNKSPDTDNGRQLRRIDRQIKKYARSREGWKGQILSGFGITKLVTECFRGDASREDKALYDTMKAIRDRLKGNLVVQHPVTPGETITSGNDEARARFLRDRLSEALDTLVLHGREEARAKAAASLLRGAAAPGRGRVHLPERTAARRQATGIRRMWWVRQEVAAVDALWEQEAWLTAARPRPSSRA
jgi:hypothetical protein